MNRKFFIGILLFFNATFSFSNSKWVLKGNQQITIEKENYVFVLEEKCEIDSNGEYLYDDGQEWRIVLIHNDKEYIVYTEYIQLGTVSFSVKRIFHNIYIFIKTPDYRICKKIGFTDKLITNNQVYRFEIIM